MSKQHRIIAIATQQTYPLRHKVLRSDYTLDDCVFPLDDEPSSYHVGYYMDQQLIGVATVVQDSPEDIETSMSGEASVGSSSSWRIRGMAVDERYRGTGVGGELLLAVISYVVQQENSDEIWCNARVDVQGFYERYGFVRIGDVFDIPTAGPHVFMKKSLTKEDCIS